MISDETGQKLHDRATRGLELTPLEREQLLSWYSMHDREEMARLGASPVPSRLADLQARVEQATSRVVEEAKRIEALTVENARLRQEIASLQRLVSASSRTLPRPSHTSRTNTATSSGFA